MERLTENTLAHEMMKTIGPILMSLAACLWAVSSRTSATPLPISTPKGFIAVKAQQKALIADIHRLTLGHDSSGGENSTWKSLRGEMGGCNEKANIRPHFTWLSRRK